MRERKRNTKEGEAASVEECWLEQFVGEEQKRKEEKKREKIKK